MSNISSRFDRFISNIQLSESELDDVITKHTAVRKALHRHYYDSGYKTLSSQDELTEQNELRYYEEIAFKAYIGQQVQLDEGFKNSTSLLVGSYGKNTEIAPPSDVDILFEMPITQFSRYEDYAYNGQSALLQDVKNVLVRRFPNTDIRADGQVVVVPFATCRVEILPAFGVAKGQYVYPDTHDGGTWRFTDPRAEKASLSLSNSRSKGNTIRLIKMIKAWKNFWAVPIKSLVIELHAVYFLYTWQYFDRSSVYYDWLVRDFLEQLSRYTNYQCQIPGLSDVISYGNDWETEVIKALSIAHRACDLESSVPDLAATEWRKLFGNRYPD